LQYPIFSLRSSSSCLRLLPLIPVTSIPPSIFPSIACFRRQFLRKALFKYWCKNTAYGIDWDVLSSDERTNTTSLSRLFPSMPAKELHAEICTLNIHVYGRLHSHALL
jgi:hypothetical protein